MCFLRLRAFGQSGSHATFSVLNTGFPTFRCPAETGSGDNLFLNYRLTVAPRKFDVLKTNFCPRANMLVLRTSNVQGATIRPMVPRQTLLSVLFTTKFWRQLTIFNFFR